MRRLEGTKDSQQQAVDLVALEIEYRVEDRRGTARPIAECPPIGVGGRQALQGCSINRSGFGGDFGAWPADDRVLPRRLSGATINRRLNT